MMLEFFILVSMLLLSGCARRPSDLFVAQAQAKQPRMNTLLLPAIRNIHVIPGNDNVVISWSPLELPGDIPDVKFIGYHVYRAAAGGFFAKKLCPLIAPHDTSYKDFSVKKNNAYYYMVRAAFLFHGRVIESPASKIIYILV